MIARVLRRLGQLVDDALGRRIRRIAHPQVDDVDPGDALVIFHLVDPPEQIGRKTGDARRNFDLKWFLAHGNARAVNWKLK